MYTIVTTPHKVLVEKAESVKKFDKRLKEILSEMQIALDATSDPKGVGLAAPQVGLSLQLFLAKPKDEGPTYVFINPLIIDTNDEVARLKRSLLEGCLSIPSIWGKVKRKKEITLKYQDVEGKVHQKKFKGFFATIIQHEIDHLNGVLFTKHVLEQGEKLYKSYKNEKGEEEFEEIKL